MVGRDGSIDWLCWPAFDSDACFASLLGTDRHGRWLIEPAEEVQKSSRRYWDNTLILETRFETANGVVALIDFMPPRGNASDVVRLVRGVTGKVKLRMQLVIRFGFGADIPWVKRTEDGALLAIAGQDMTVLRTPVETHGEDLTTVAGFEVSEARPYRSCSPMGLHTCRCPRRSTQRKRCRTPRTSGSNGAAAAPMKATTAIS